MRLKICRKQCTLLLLFCLVTVYAALPSPVLAQTTSARAPTISTEVAADESLPLSELARRAVWPTSGVLPDERGPEVADNGFSGALTAEEDAASFALTSAAIPPPTLTFEGLANTNNPFLVAPPDPIGDVGPNHYVEMVNLVFGVYSKTGQLLVGPTPIGALWDSFSVPDCQDLSGDPVVVYDQLVNRWILSQFTTRGPIFYECVAISKTPDPTGSYYRYAFSTGENFPDYPKLGVWTDMYVLTTREFGPAGPFAGIGVYALEKNKMLGGQRNVRAIKFLLEPGTTPYLTGDGLLPPDIDGNRRPQAGIPAPVIGTMDDGGGYGAPFDGLNIFDLAVHWDAHPSASFTLVAQLPVAAFDSIFPCSPSSRSCILQPGTSQKVDILSYRQRPTWRLAYRNFGKYESMVTNQSVEALPAVAGIRWYEIRRVDGQYSVFQQGTYAPNDGVHRWMGSIAMDRDGNAALGYSVSNATTVFPGIRYTGRLQGDPLGQLPLGEAVLINGSGSQTGSARWGDYTSMNVDPADDCTFWYVNEYYQITSAGGWQTRIGNFKLPGCSPAANK